jgi:hypothetical protein
MHKSNKWSKIWLLNSQLNKYMYTHSYHTCIHTQASNDFWGVYTFILYLYTPSYYTYTHTQASHDFGVYIKNIKRPDNRLNMCKVYTHVCVSMYALHVTHTNQYTNPKMFFCNTYRRSFLSHSPATLIRVIMFIRVPSCLIRVPLSWSGSRYDDPGGLDSHGCFIDTADFRVKISCPDSANLCM